MIPKSFVQELLGRVDIVDVIESYLPLKRAGANLVACCPFHSEKTPSFTVSPTKQFYHCFGCGAHGSAIGFLIEYGAMGYVEAVKDLAARTGMRMPELTPTVQEAAKQAQSEELTHLLQRAAQFYKAELKRSEAAIAYLKGRGLTGEIAARFQLGYAPAGWQSLAGAFENYQAKALVEAGLVIQGEDGKRYDRFRDRIMFPIINQRGQVVGFGGRVLDKSEPKYLNSPETPLFEKGRELYGLFQARQGIRAAGRVLVVEGYMDVVALAQYGVGYAVATLGTATTTWHVQKLLRQADEVVFCFDGDAAGKRAAWRALENSLSQLQDGKQVKFLFLPEADDPDSYIRREGTKAFERLLAEQAVPLSEFLVKELTDRVDMTSAEGRAKFLQDGKPLVKQVSAPILGLMLRKRMAELARISAAELDGQFGAQAVPPVKVIESGGRRRTVSFVRKLLRVLVLRPHWASEADPQVLTALLHATSPDGSPEEWELLEQLLRLLQADSKLLSFVEEFRGSELQELVGVIEHEAAELERDALPEEGLHQDFLGAWGQVLKIARKAELAELETRLIAGQASAEDKERFRTLHERPGAGLQS
jgi:DNA primase